MEQIENKMLIDEYWERSQFNWNEYYDYLSEESDRRLEDIINDD